MINNYSADLKRCGRNTKKTKNKTFITYNILEYVSKNNRLLGRNIFLK